MMTVGCRGGDRARRHLARRADRMAPGGRRRSHDDRRVAHAFPATAWRPSPTRKRKVTHRQTKS